MPRTTTCEKEKLTHFYYILYVTIIMEQVPKSFSPGPELHMEDLLHTYVHVVCCENRGKPPFGRPRTKHEED